MNHIQNLSDAVACQVQARRITNTLIADFLRLLNGPKFQGTEGGERKDWIATGDVISRLMELRTALQVDNDLVAKFEKRLGNEVNAELHASGIDSKAYLRDQPYCGQINFPLISGHARRTTAI